ncbi:GNAT family N-acetyltransferase [Sphingobium sp. AN641]|uniref:GNAT family N-acetyltransferase n=1 Tax=Sphingobium sp. AN641 TaxID=3133443 RepID=UPI0030BD23A5
MPYSLLDRPVWNALATGWSAFAQGDDQARRIDAQYGPFGASADHGDAAKAALARLAPKSGELWIVERPGVSPPSGLCLVREAGLAQMVADTVPDEAPPGTPLLLTDQDADDMRALALLTRPGPFHPLTHRLGRFIGIRDKGVLVAMAGERMRMSGLTEVSGVCTHPDHRGRGHARVLMRHVMRAMQARGETPFLHAYAAHEATIALYETLGFRVRAHMQLSVMART